MSISLIKPNIVPTLSLRKPPMPIRGNGGYPAWMGTKPGRTAAR